jgi:hypothetical protein
MAQLPPTSAYPQVPMFEEPPRKSRTGLWIGLAVAAVLVFCLAATGVGALVYFANRHKDTVTTAPTGPAASPSTTRGTVILTAPDAIGSRGKNNDPQLNESLQNATRSLTTRMSSSGIGEPVGAFYGSSANQDLMMIFGVPTPAGAGAMPDAMVDQLFTMMGTIAGATAREARAVDPGPLGGKAKCADLDLKGVPAALCGWSDAGSFGYIVWYFMTVAQVQGEFVTVRELIEHRA